MKLKTLAVLATLAAVPAEAHAQSFWSRITQYVASNAYAQNNGSRTSPYFTLHEYVPGTGASLGSISINSYGFPNKPLSRMNAYERSLYNTLTARRANKISAVNRSTAVRNSIIANGWDPYACTGCAGTTEGP